MSIALLLIACVLAGILLVGVSVVRPLWGLLLGSALIYNPVFNYRFLFTHQFEGGSERTILSLCVLACLYVGIVIDRVRTPSRPALAPRVPWQLAYLALAVVGAAGGLLAGHQLRLVAADFFPIFEFAAYFPLVGLMARDSQDSGRLAIGLLIWSSAVAAVEVALYLVDGGDFASRFALNGGTTLIPRLDDFIPALFLPLGLALIGHVRAQPLRGIAVAASLALATATAFSFFRSLWAGLVVAVAVMLAVAFIGPGRHLRLDRDVLTRAAGVCAILVVLILAVTLIKIGPEGSVASLIVSRAAHIETTSGAARVTDNLQLMGMIRAHPFGIGLGGMEGSLPLFSTSDYYLSAAVELGIVAVALLLAIGVTFLVHNIARYRRTTDPLGKAIVLGTLGSYTCMAVTLLTFPSLLHYPIPAFLGLLGGIVTLVGRPSAAPAGVQSRSSWPLRAERRDLGARPRT